MPRAPTTACPSGKFCHPTADAAWKLLRLRKSKAWLITHKQRGLKGGVYRCAACGHWHLTRESKPRDHQPRYHYTPHFQQEAQP